jgi:hypothetical protein
LTWKIWFWLQRKETNDCAYPLREEEVISTKNKLSSCDVSQRRGWRARRQHFILLPPPPDAFQMQPCGFLGSQRWGGGWQRRLP